MKLENESHCRKNTNDTLANLQKGNKRALGYRHSDAAARQTIQLWIGSRSRPRRSTPTLGLPSWRRQRPRAARSLPVPPATKASPGTAATTPGSKVVPDIKEHKGRTGGGTTPSTATTTPPRQKLPTKAARPPTPHVVRPHTSAAIARRHASAAPPPTRPAAPPAPAAKPKCQPGQHR
jgi:hypothetical protein